MSTPDANERELLSRVLQRDEEAIQSFVQRYTPLLSYGVVRSAQHFGAEINAQVVEEALEEVFEALAEDNQKLLREFQFHCDLPAYLMIVSNHVMNRRFSKNDDSVDDPPSPEERERFREEYVELAPRDRLVLNLLVHSNKSRQEVAQTVNVPMKVVGLAVVRAKDRIGILNVSKDS